jgi:hypothetical protein
MFSQLFHLTTVSRNVIAMIGAREMQGKIALYPISYAPPKATMFNTSSISQNRYLVVLRMATSLGSSSWGGATCHFAR